MSLDQLFGSGNKRPKGRAAAPAFRPSELRNPATRKAIGRDAIANDERRVQTERSDALESMQFQQAQKQERREQRRENREKQQQEALQTAKQTKNAIFEKHARNSGRPFYEDEFGDYQWSQDDTTWQEKQQEAREKRNAELREQWTAEKKAEETKLANQRSFEKKKLSTQRGRIDYDPRTHERLKKELPETRKEIIDNATLQLDEHFRAKFGEDKEAYEAATERLFAGDVDDEDLEAVREKVPTLFEPYDQTRKKLTDFESRKEQDDQFRTQLEAIENAELGLSLPTEEQLAKKREDIEARRQQIETISTSVAEQADQITTGYETAMAQLQEQERKLLTEGAPAAEIVAQRAAILDQRLSLENEYQSKLEEIDATRVRAEWESEQLQSDVEKYQQSLAAISPTLDDSPAARETSPGAGAEKPVNSQTFDRDLTETAETPATSGDDKPTASPESTATAPPALQRYGMTLRAEKTEESPVVAKFERDKERGRVLVVEDFSQLDSVVTSPERDKGEREAIYASPKVSAAITGSTPAKGRRLPDAEADAWIADTLTTFDTEFSKVKTNGADPDSVAAVSQWQQEQASDAVNRFRRGEISLDQLNRATRAAGLSESGISLFQAQQERLQSVADAREAVSELYRGSEANDTALSPSGFLKGVGEAASPVSLLGLVTKGKQLAKLAQNPAEVASDRYATAVQDFEAREANTKEAFAAYRETVKAEEDAIFAQYDIPDEVADTMRVDAALEGFRTRKRGTIETLVETLNAPEKKAAFTGALAKLEDLTPVIAAAEKARRAKERGEPVELTDTERAMIGAWLDETSREATRGAQVVDIVSELPAFGIELATTGGFYTAGKKGASEALERWLKRLLTKETTDLLKGAVLKTTGDAAIEAADTATLKWLGETTKKSIAGVVGATLQTPLAGAGRITAGTLEGKYLPQLENLDAHPDLESWIASPGLSATHALAASGFDTWAEVVSERSGGLFERFGAVAKLPAGLQEKAARLGFVQSLKKLNPGRGAGEIAAFSRRMGWNGIFSEMLEERVGDVIRGAGDVASGGRVGEEFQLPTMDQLITEMIAFAIPGGAIGIANETQLSLADRKIRRGWDRVAKSTEDILAAPPELTADRIKATQPDLTAPTPEAITQAKETFGSLGQQTTNETNADRERLMGLYEQARAEGDSATMASTGQLIHQLEARRATGTLREMANTAALSEAIAETRSTAEKALAIAQANGDEIAMIQAQDQQRLADLTTAAVKIGMGQPLTNLTAAEQSAISQTMPDGTPPIDTAGETPIVTEALRREVLAQFPQANPFLRLSETEARERFSAPETEAEPGTAEATNTNPAPSNEEATSNPEPSGPANSAPDAGTLSETATPAAAQLRDVADTPESGELLDSPSADQVAPSVSDDPVEQRVTDLTAFAERMGVAASEADTLAREHVASRGVTDSNYQIQALRDFAPTLEEAGYVLDANSAASSAELTAETAPEPSQANDLQRPEAARLQELMDAVKVTADRFGPDAFPGGIEVAALEDGGGLAYQDGKLLVDPSRMLQNYEGASTDLVEAAVTEEFIHRVSTELFTPESIVDLWGKLPATIQTTVREAYFNAYAAAGREMPQGDPFALGHEFLRMLVQDKAFAGQITESTEIPASLLEEIVDFLKRLSDYLRNAVQSAPAEVRAEIEAYESRIIERIEQLVGPAETATLDAPATRRKSIADSFNPDRPETPTLNWLRENPIRAKNSPKIIGIIGRVRNRQSRGQTVSEKDLQVFADYDGQPKNEDYPSAVQKHLKGIFQRNDAKADPPDVVAQMAFDRNLIDSPTTDALYALMRQELDSLANTAGIPKEVAEIVEQAKAAGLGSAEARQMMAAEGVFYEKPIEALYQADRGSGIEALPGFQTFRLTDGRVLSGPALFSPERLKAFHGTPHKVDRFSTEKIGTGEGAQAYGWGLYFAGDEAVAESYRITLSDQGTRYMVDGEEVFRNPDKSPEHLAIQGIAQNGIERERVVLAEWRDQGLDPEWVEEFARALDEYEGRVTSEPINPGNLYTVELDANVDEFLDWDKPLSEQSEANTAALRKIFRGIGLVEKNGYDPLKEMGFISDVWQLLADNKFHTADGPKYAAAKLQKAGIKGIRYLDGNSRADGEGSYNYVIFDESIIHITEENGQPVNLQEAEPALNQAERIPTPALPSTVREPGETLLDGAVNRVRSAIAEAPTVAKLKNFLAKEYDKDYARPLKLAVDFVIKQAAPLHRLPEEIRALMNEMRIKQSYGQERSMDVVRSVSNKAKFSDLAYPKEFANDMAMRKRLFLAMNGEADMATLPEPMQAFAGRLRELLKQTGLEAVRQGRMHPDTYLQMQQNNYMPHYFYDHEVAKNTLGGLFRRMALGIQDIMAQTTTMWRIEDWDSRDPDTGEPGALITYEEPTSSGKTRNKVRFNSKQHRDAFYEDYIQERVLTEVKGRAKAKTFSADTRAQIDSLTLNQLREPERLTGELRGYAKRVEQEMRKRYRKGNPLTLEQKEKAGLIMDPVYAVARHIAQMEHDNAIAGFFNGIVEQSQAHPEWFGAEGVAGYTKLPSTRRLGNLSGMHVRDDIAEQITELVNVPDMAVKFYDAFLAAWKTGKTVYNPGTHMRNVLGNVLFAQMAGVNPVTNGRAYREAFNAIRTGGPVLEEMFQEGVLGADFLSAELQDEISSLLPMLNIEDGDSGIWTKLGIVMNRAWHKVGGAKGKELIEKSYQLEDELFKAAAYLKAKEKGMSPKDAAVHVRKWFPYYDHIGTSASIRAARRTAMPFFSFAREAVRILGNATAERPITLAASMALPMVLSRVSAELLGLDDDDYQNIRETALRGKGRFFGRDQPLFSLLLPVRSAEGRVQQWDLSNVNPFAFVLGRRLEMDNGNPAWQQWALELIAGSPLTGIPLEMAFNTDTFSNRPIWEENMEPEEKFGAMAEHVATQLLPPLTPFVGTSANMIESAGERYSNKSLEKRNRAQSFLRAIAGVDIRNASPNIYDLADEFREQQGIERNDFIPMGTSPESRARKRIWTELVQDEIDHKSIARDLAFLELEGKPIKNRQDLQRLLFFRHPLMVIKGKENQQRFLASLSGEAREVTMEAIREFERIESTSWSTLRKAMMEGRRLAAAERTTLAAN